jgi:two-component system, OmpR family, phosphate regulon sensor histidine kinase PhoR
MVSQKMDEKNIQVAVNLETDLHVLGEENRLIQIFTNLVNNAVMYSPEDSALTINAFEQNQFGVIEVIDEGVGIDKADLARVFERFYRVDTARSRNSGGTGLGLAIVKHLVELHHGKIEVESDLGQGTTMRVKIPLKRVS